MTVFDWLTGCFSSRGKALALYKRGMAKAKKHDHQGAIEAYSSTIAMPHTPADVKAMVLYNRALAHVANGDDQRGVEDLKAVLAMEESMINVKTMARHQLVRMSRRSKV